jgi:hypothetical protein
MHRDNEVEASEGRREAEHRHADGRSTAIPGCGCGTERREDGREEVLAGARARPEEKSRPGGEQVPAGETEPWEREPARADHAGHPRPGDGEECRSEHEPGLDRLIDDQSVGDMTVAFVRPEGYRSVPGPQRSSRIADQGDARDTVSLDATGRRVS